MNVIVGIFFFSSLCDYCCQSWWIFLCLLLRQEKANVPWGCVLCEVDGKLWCGMWHHLLLVYFCNAEFFQKSFVLLVMVIPDHGLVDGLVSVWLHIDLQVDLTKETLMKQFQIVKEETNTSHVMQYGDMVYLFYMKWIRPPTPSSFPDYSAVPIYTPVCMVRVKCLV